MLLNFKKSYSAAKTYSVNFTIQYFFWALSILLYNTWILCNVCAYTNREVDPAKQGRPLITAFRFGITMKTAFLSPKFSGDGSEKLLQGLKNSFVVTSSERWI
jgi:hypothetical protein